MRRVLFACALVLAACGDNKKPADDPADAAPVVIDAPVVEPIDAGVDATVITPCALDRPGELARPPSGSLPCELLPPGFTP